VRIYLARHGETTWNLAGRYQGRRESALTSLGMQQAFALADTMMPREIGRVVTSPLLRCVATAQPTAERLNLEAERDDRLLEIEHGTWNGRLRDEIAANDPERYRAWRQSPATVAFEGGETLVQVRDRWRAFAAAFLPETPALVVTHDAVVRVALVDMLGRELDAFWDVHVENGAFAVLERDDTGWTLVDECVNDHLGALRAEIASQAL
jgi:phosphoserine phosphatase